MEDTLQVKENGKELALPPKDEKSYKNGAEASQHLKSFMAKKDKHILYNGREYPEFNDLQVLSAFFGYTINTHDAAPFELGTVKGFKARADLVDSSGIVVGGAEAYCMRDEKVWAEKPIFQLASMAQTRAGAKALRNKFAWIVRMAGFEATPAEEMGEVITPYAQSENKSHSRLISEPQRKRLYAIWKNAGKDDSFVLNYLTNEYHITKTSDITTDIYEQICSWAANVKTTPIPVESSAEFDKEYEELIRAGVDGDTISAYCDSLPFAGDLKAVAQNLNRIRTTVKPEKLKDALTKHS